jgi:beta-galactosidase GanA
MPEINRRSFNALASGAAASLIVPSRPAGATPGPVPAPGRTPHLNASHTVSFDKYSLIVDGQRLVLWSGEFHPFRLPSPSLWTDVLQKMRANGYNAVSIYVAWNFHSPAPGSYDFTGVRDLGRFLTAAADAGLFVIVRPGPYINAEVDAGGYPGWMTVSSGTARTDNSGYLGHADEWLTAVNAIVSKHQYTDGGGTVLLYQLENEYSSHLSDGVGSSYMAHLYAKARGDGITVPLFHNDKGRNGDWVPGSFSTGEETGRYLYAFDGYPSPSSTPPDWGYFGTGGATGGSTASPNTPGFEAEFGGGWFDCWGGAEFAGQGYAGARASRDAVYERRFYLTNLANGIKLQNVYMTFGGTSWGWLPAPVVYTSYDYGAALDEARNQTSKLVPMKQIGLMLESVPDLAELDRDVSVAASSALIKTYHLTNPATGAHFYFLRNDSSSTVSAVTLPMTTSAGTLTVPASGGGMSFTGKDMKVLATGIRLGHRTLLYATAQPMYQATIGARDLTVFTGRGGDPVEVVLLAAKAPVVTVLAGSATSAYDSADQRLRINAILSGLIRVLIDFCDGGLPLLILLADDTASAALWRQTTLAGPVLVRGPSLVRASQSSGSAVRLTGDTTTAGDLEVWAPTGVSFLTWNGAAVNACRSSSGSLVAKAQLPGPAAVALPALTGWRYAAENPESAPEFDDSTWPAATKPTSGGITPVPSGQPVLFADDYGFHYGDVWYRGRYSGTSDATSISLAYSSGTQGLLMAWLDGTPLGTHRQPVPTSSQATTQNWTATATFTIPTALRGSGDHVLSVLVRPMAHSEDGGGNDAHKTARGLTAATFAGAAPTLSWRIQGGSTAADALRGPLNTGGLYGERNGWHLPTFADSAWQPIALPRADTFQGVRWYRTRFAFAPPPGVDASVGLSLTDASTHAYRVQIFLNGWNLGQYINDVGPQRTFVLPNGILLAGASNVLALAVLADGTTPAGPGSVALTLLGSAAGGVSEACHRTHRRSEWS